MRRARLNAGGLDAVILEPRDPPAPLDFNVLLCHGFGAPGDDLVPLADELSALAEPLAARVRWIYPEAPLSLEEMGSPWGRAWWHLDLERLVVDRDWARYSEESPEGLSKARRMLRALLDDLAQRTGVPLARTVLGGFSQGAMLATDLALRLEEPPAGLCILSGTVLSRAAWKELIARRTALPIFQSHGARDALLPFELADELHRIFTDAGASVKYVPFQGEHTISMIVLQALAAWLAERVTADSRSARQ